MNRFVLNETSYHGAGAIAAIATEIQARGFKKALVASDPDLIKFGVTAKVTAVLDNAAIPTKFSLTLSLTPLSRMFRQVLKHSRLPVLTVS